MTEIADPDATTAEVRAVPDAPYPAHWEADVVASDGATAHLRPISADDADDVVAFHARLSDRTRYFRYFSPYPRIPERDLKNFVEVDHHDRVALVLWLGREIIAIGRYVRLAQTTAAEVAFVVRDDHQGRGLGLDPARAPRRGRPRVRPHALRRRGAHREPPDGPRLPRRRVRGQPRARGVDAAPGVRRRVDLAVPRGAARAGAARRGPQRRQGALAALGGRRGRLARRDEDRPRRPREPPARRVHRPRLPGAPRGAVGARGARLPERHRDPRRRGPRRPGRPAGRGPGRLRRVPREGGARRSSSSPRASARPARPGSPRSASW